VQATRTRTRLRLTIAAWTAILILTGSFQLYRGAISDGIVFFAMGVALIVGRAPVLRRSSERRWQPRRALVVIALAFGAAALVLTPRHGIMDGIVVAASGILVFIVAWPDPQPDDTADSRWTPRLQRSALAWAILGVVFCAWELAMYFLGYGLSGRTAYPALSDLLDPVLDNPFGRVLGVAAWLAGGVALARRGRTAHR
jgi:hypothetical protein